MAVTKKEIERLAWLAKLKFTDEELDELTPAYAISIHKSQGSEYPAVVIPLMPQLRNSTSVPSCSLT